ncbi:MAG: hypothetical protein AAGF30_07830, partial [Pseudomonadota bacterium]
SFKRPRPALRAALIMMLRLALPCIGPLRFGQARRVAEGAAGDQPVLGARCGGRNAGSSRKIEVRSAPDSWNTVR